MAVFFWYLFIKDASVHYCTVAYTGQDTFYKVPERTRPCIAGDPVYPPLPCPPWLWGAPKQELINPLFPEPVYTIRTRPYAKLQGGP